MSVVVRMEMPKNCDECPICGTASGGNGMYKLWCICGDIPASAQRRPDDCPILCQLPEGHGRLVDEKSVRWAIDDIVLEIANRTGRVGMTKDETMEYINNLYTIVPAERYIKEYFINPKPINPLLSKRFTVPTKEDANADKGTIAGMV